MTTTSSNILVLWAVPEPALGASGDRRVLSFLTTEEENALLRRAPELRLRSGRLLFHQVADETTRIINELVVQVGLWPHSEGTFRQRLERDELGSDWWRHPLSFRDSEKEEVFRFVGEVLAVLQFARESGCQAVHIVGAPCGVEDVLRQHLRVSAIASRLPPPRWKVILQGLVSRSRLLIRFSGQKLLLAGATVPRAGVGILLQGFFDWSYWLDADAGLRDRYFKALPAELHRRGLKFAYLTRFDLATSWSFSLSNIRKLRRVVSSGYSAFLESEVSSLEILRLAADIHPWLLYRRVLADRIGSGQVLLVAGSDWYPVFAPFLERNFANASIPTGRFYSLASFRLTSRLRPSVFLSFLEHFPVTRSQVQGVKLADPGVVCLAMQHASYCRGKLFHAIDARSEFRGEPDGCIMPHPDKILVMGALAQRLFAACGYQSADVPMVGSARYDVKLGAAEDPAPTGGLRVLIAGSLSRETEMDLAIAVLAAAAGIKGIEIRLRSHPFCPLGGDPSLRPFAGRFATSTESLNDDIRWCHVVLFTTSTVAEEAILQGRPVWQWVPAGFNASAVAHLGLIRQFTTLPELKSAFRAVIESGEAVPVPGCEDREIVINELFAPADGEATNRIAALLALHATKRTARAF